MWLPSFRTTIVAAVLAAVIGAGVLMARSGAHHRTAVSIADAVGVSASDAGRTDAAPSVTNPPPPLNLRPVVSSTYQRVRRVVSQSVHRVAPARTAARASRA